MLLLLGGSFGGALAQDAGGEGDDARMRGLVLPVQTVVDAFPVLVDEAIVEAEFDGTPDRAEAILAEMEAYVAAFSKPHHWPEGSAAQQIAYVEALRFAADVVALAQWVPSVAARVEIVRASCAAFEAASADEAQAWLRESREARLDHGVLMEGLLDARKSLPLPVDDEPLLRGFERLESWGNTSLEASLRCSDEAAVFFDVYEPDDALNFFVRPATTWPSADVQFFGAVGADTDADAVVLSGPRLGLDREVPVGANGGFFVRHEVPLDTALVAHEVVAQAAGHEESVTVTVTRAPVTLVVEHPQRVAPGQSFSLQVRLLDPLDLVVEDTRVVAGGDREGELVLQDGRGSVQWVAPDAPGVLQGVVTFDGDAIRAPAEASWQIQVREETTVAGPEDEAFFWTDRGLLQSVLMTVAVVLVGLVLLFLGARLWPGRKRRGKEIKGQADAGAGERFPGPGAPFVKVYAAFHGWCVRMGWVGPAATARDVTRRFGAGVALRRATTEFERVRYGGGREHPQRSHQALLSTIAAWRDGMKRFIGHRKK